jgi:hypothetical protein
MPKDSGRNDALNCASFNMFQLVASGDLTDSMVRAGLFAAATACGLVDEDGAAQVWKTIDSGERAGREQPRTNGHEDPEEPPDLKSARASSYEMSEIQWLWPDRFALGKLGLLAGLPDEGKGQVFCDMAARVTHGLAWPCDEGVAPQGNVVLLTAEDDPRDTVVPRLAAAGADLDLVEIVQEQRQGPHVHRLGSGHRQVKLVLIDPITAYLGVKQMDSFRTRMCVLGW